ncbi:MAG: hypothetical protein L6408_07635 [Nanoarchaeota archaeon]|nr:hypothetical protein [Nanoarchaeota archaeon]
MKMYKKFKGMSKEAKFCLAGTILYTTILALPAFASMPLEGSDIKEEIKLEYNTSEEAKSAYKQKLEEYSLDKKLEKSEILDLHNLVEQGKTLEMNAYRIQREDMENKFYTLKEEKGKLKTEKDRLLSPIYETETLIENKNSEICTLEENIKKEENHKKIFNTYEQDIEKIKKDLDDLINIHYPGLLRDVNQPYNVIYSPQIETSKGFDGMVDKLVKKSENIFRVIYQSEALHYVSNNRLLLKDVLSFRELWMVR